MQRAWFPTLKELSRELSHEIVEACGGEACVELIQREPHALRVLLLVALLPGLGLKMIRDAYPDTAMAQKRLRPVLDELPSVNLYYRGLGKNREYESCNSISEGPLLQFLHVCRDHLDDPRFIRLQRRLEALIQSPENK